MVSVAHTNHTRPGRKVQRSIAKILGIGYDFGKGSLDAQKLLDDH